MKVSAPIVKFYRSISKDEAERNIMKFAQRFQVETCNTSYTVCANQREKGNGEKFVEKMTNCEAVTYALFLGRP